MNKNLLMAGAALVVLIAAGAFFLSSDSDSNDSTSASQETTNQTNTAPENNTVPEPSEATAATTEVSSADLATHNTASDCWTEVSGSVYNITDYVPRHPGGDTILAACGTDGTSLFELRVDADGNQVGSGTPHSSSAADQLKDFLVGPLGS